MLPTEVQRILLLVGLAATGYLLILAWNEDYVQNEARPQYDDAPVVQTNPGTVEFQEQNPEAAPAIVARWSRGGEKQAQARSRTS